MAIKNNIIDTDILIDARGMRCPWPVLRVAKVMREAEEGRPITIVADDPIASTELAAFAKECGMSLVETSTPIGAGYRFTPIRQGV